MHLDLTLVFFFWSLWPVHIWNCFTSFFNINFIGEIMQIWKMICDFCDFSPFLTKYCCIWTTKHKRFSHLFLLPWVDCTLFVKMHLATFKYKVSGFFFWKMEFKKLDKYFDCSKCHLIRSDYLSQIMILTSWFFLMKWRKKNFVSCKLNWSWKFATFSFNHSR